MWTEMFFNTLGWAMTVMVIGLSILAADNLGRWTVEHVLQPRR